MMIHISFDMNLEMRGSFVWKADNTNTVRRMSNINENLLANLEANSEKVAKMIAIKEFDDGENTYWSIVQSNTLFETTV